MRNGVPLVVSRRRNSDDAISTAKTGRTPSAGVAVEDRRMRL